VWELLGDIWLSAHILKGQKELKKNDPVLHLKFLEKQEQAKPKTSRRREIIKIRVKIKEIETKKKKKIQRINKTKSWFFEKINKIDQPLANLTKMRREKTQVSKIRHEKER
jgi:hypothetical protein